MTNLPSKAGHICNLSLRVTQPSEAYHLREAVRNFLGDRDDCYVTSCGRNCADPTLTDIEIRVKSRQTANRVVSAVRNTYSNSCEIDVEMVV